MSSWVDSNGKKYDPSYMTDSHLTNVLNYIRRLIEADSNYIPPPSYKSLIKEHDRRK